MRHVLLAAALLCSGLAAAAPLTAAQAQAAKSDAKSRKPRLGKVFPYYENYLRIPAAERTRFTLAYVVTANDKPATDLALYAVDGARREPIAIGPDGRMRPPPLEMLRSKTAVLDGPKGRNIGIAMSLLATATPAREMEAAELDAALAQTNAGIRKAAGPIGMVAPKMARIIFAEAGSGEAVLADGRRTPLPVLRGSPYYQPSTLPGVRRLVFARTPAQLMIGPAAPKKKG
jgi:hypothetical protein